MLVVAGLGLTIELLTSLPASTQTTMPVVRELIPTTASVGARLLLVGQGLDAADLAVSFRGADPARPVPAPILSRTATLLELSVPSGAVSGPVQIMQGGTLVGTVSFTLVPLSPFTAVAPLAGGPSGNTFKEPSSLTVVIPDGTVYVADTQHHQIRAIRPSGPVSVLAGTGASGSRDGAATVAQFKEPNGLAYDAGRRMFYVADTANHRIRAIGPDGQVRTVAGTDKEGRADGTGPAAQFSKPTGLAVHPTTGDLYVANTGTHTIRTMTPAGVVTTLAGSGVQGLANGPAGTASFNHPEGLALAPDGALYVADTDNHVIRKIAGGIVTTVAGTGREGFRDGPAGQAEFSKPSGVAVDEAGALLVADSENGRIRRVTVGAESVLVTTVAGGAPGPSPSVPTTFLARPTGLAMEGALYVADRDTQRVVALVRTPTGSALYPRRGPLGGGTEVRLFGTGFVPGRTQVTFGTVPAPTVTYVTSTLLVVSVPAKPVGAADTVDVAVTTPGGTATQSAGFIYLAPPVIATVTPLRGRAGTTVTVTGQQFDPDAGGTVLQFNGVAATVTSVTATSLTTTVPAGATTGPLTVQTAGGIAVSPAPFTLLTLVIDRMSPASGPIGATVTLTGEGFAPVAANNQVRFNGVAAGIVSATTTTITTIVPQHATTGPVTVTTPEGTATSSAPFTVTRSSDFALSAAPATVSVPQGSRGSVLVSLASTGASSFTGLAALAVSGLPAGATAIFEPPQLTAGQSALLRLSTGAAPAGSRPLLITGTATIDGQTITRTASVTLTVLSGGQTSVSGQFLTTAGAPIPGVQVTLGTVQTPTDAGGNFLLQNVPAGTQQLMFSGTIPNAGGFVYAADVPLTAGQANVLPPFYIMPQPPPERFTPISNATAFQVITDARVPGASMTLPAGMRIIGWDGVPKTKIAIERLELDKLGVPLPPVPVRSVYQPFFGTPMGGYVDPPGSVIAVTVPNDLDLSPGQQADLWVYDAAPTGGPAGWKNAGRATVSADGTQIASNPGLGITRFCFKCGLWTCTPVGTNAAGLNLNPQGPKGADPVDLATGQFVLEKTELVLPGRLPVTLSRSYHPVDAYGGVGGLHLSVGVGWALSVDVTLFPLPGGQAFRLVLPANTRLDLSRQADGTFQNLTHPLLKGAVLSTLPGGDHLLRFKDGATWRFQRRFTFADGTGVDFLMEQADRNGNRLTIERSGHVLARLVDAAGRALTVSTAGGRITEIQDALGRTVRYEYGTDGRLAVVTDPAGQTTRYTYDSAGRILTSTDARGIGFIENVSGPSGRILRQVQADVGEWRFRYRLQGATVTGPGCPGTACPTEDSWEHLQAGYRVTGGTVVATTVVDPDGQTTTHRFTPTGFSAEQVDGQGQATVSTRNAGNQVTASTDVLGRTTRLTYDAAGNTTSITDPAGTATRFEYEPVFNRVTKITDALNQSTTFTYDVKGNLLTTTNPKNETTTIAYNQFGQPTNVTDALNQTTMFAYDTVGNLITTADALGNQTQRVYDNVSRLVSLADPRNFSTQFRYDELNRVGTIADARHGMTRFDYDPNGNLLTVTDTKNQTTTYTYDVMDRLATRKDALNRQEAYQYDLAGNLTQFRDRKNQVTTFVYDPLNRRTSALFADGSSTTFTYDAGGRLSAVTDSVSGTIQFVYDKLDRLIQEITPQGAVAYAYDALGRRTSMTVSGLAPVTYQYDAASRLIRVAQGSFVVTIGYDAAGRRTTLTYSNGVTTTYTYDAASRLTGLVHAKGAALIESLSYAYDPAGNRTGLTRANGPATHLPAAVQAAYDAANQLIQFNGNPVTHDANGNLVNDGTITHSWNARNRLIARTGPGLSESFQYDALGRRISKTINGITTRFLYDGNDIVAELTGNAVSATYLRSLNIDEPFIRQSSTGNEYYHTDALGSTLALTNDAGQVTTAYSYDPFGKTTVSGTPSTNPFQYTGRENDGTGLYYYRARYYSPTLQRFLSEDPIGLLAGDVNFYEYVHSNPVNLADPSGKILPLLALALVGTGGLVNGVIEAGAAAFDTQYPIQLTKAFGKGFVSGSVGTATGLTVGLLTANPVLVGTKGVKS